MTLILSLLIFNLGFVVGTWWAARFVKRKTNDASRPGRIHPFQHAPRRAPLYKTDPIASQN